MLWSFVYLAVRGALGLIVLAVRPARSKDLEIVIVQADDLRALSTVVVCPTSTSTPPASFHPKVENADEPTRVMCKMVGAVDARMLGHRVAHATRPRPGLISSSGTFTKR